MTYLRIKELAEAKGWNIQQLSWNARLSYSSAHALWNDKPKQLDRPMLDRVARALEVNVSDLFGGEPTAQEGDSQPLLLAA
ncbi:helix-turn-helix transcriptional regulator [Oscillochloris sp. ZM17-4]|uniref:helix-turn-helix domain-containing protein n=1 Tax=Oscillochloris sp. ZM17-4 TaxID=2866714 RepID=UPI001C736ABD|nr:helix-turn-helix transcriptional regulator [Oscillochloris sp. ZM17-4]MBX0326961.1 helix-turn-helix transcriptional regulator [Oscillochloris sp. ZM17-4]